MFSVNELFEIYSEFLKTFPENIRGFVSLGIAVLIVIGVYKVIRKQFVYLILLVMLLPASVPVLKNIWENLLQILRFLVTR